MRDGPGTVPDQGATAVARLLRWPQHEAAAAVAAGQGMAVAEAADPTGVVGCPAGSARDGAGVPGRTRRWAVRGEAPDGVPPGRSASRRRRNRRLRVEVSIPGWPPRRLEWRRSRGVGGLGGVGLPRADGGAGCGGAAGVNVPASRQAARNPSPRGRSSRGLCAVHHRGRSLLVSSGSCHAGRGLSSINYIAPWLRMRRHVCAGNREQTQLKV